MISGIAEVPVVQGFTADAERVLLTLTGPRDMAVGGYRHRKVGSAHLYTDSGSSRYSSEGTPRCNDARRNLREQEQRNSA